MYFLNIKYNNKNMPNNIDLTILFVLIFLIIIVIVIVVLIYDDSSNEGFVAKIDDTDTELLEIKIDDKLLQPWMI